MTGNPTMILPPLRTGHRNGPGLAPRFDSQSNNAKCPPAGGNTLRCLLPFPTTVISLPEASTSATIKPTASLRRNPHPNNKLNAAASRDPAAVPSAQTSNNADSSLVDRARPASKRLPLTDAAASTARW